MGTSLLDLPIQGDPIAALMRAMSSPDKATRDAATLAFQQATGAHRLPAMVSTATPLAHELPAMKTVAPRMGTLPAMHSVGAAPSTTPALWQVGNPSAVAAGMPIASTPSQPTGAIGQMMQGLLAQMQPPQPQGGLLGAPTGGPSAAQEPPGPMPQGAPSGPVPSQQGVTLPPQQNMIGRIHDRLQGLLSSGSNIGAPADATEYSGVGLSPDEIQRAKPGFMARLSSITPGAPTPGQQYQNNLNHIVNMHSMATTMAENARIRDARKQMSTLFPLPPNPTLDDIRTNLAQQYSYAMSHNDTETMKDVGSRLSSIFTAPHTPANQVVAPGGAVVDAKGNPLYQAPVIPDKGKSPSEIPGTPEWKAAESFKAALIPREDRTLVQVQDPTDPTKTILLPRAQAAGMTVAAKGGAKAATAQNMATEALLRSSVSEMNNADKYMQTFEGELASGKRSINGIAQFLGGVGNSFTHDDPASRAVQNVALTALNKVNPELARYIRRGLSFAEGEAGISKRPSDFRTKMAAFLSTVASGASPEMISDIQSRRGSILHPLNQIMDANPVAGSKPASALPPVAPARPSAVKPRITADQADFLRTKKGMSPADIAERYTVSP